MHFKAHWLNFIPIVLQLVSPSHACLPDLCSFDERNEAHQYPWAELGSDEPSDPATKGYFINHLSINVRNLTTSMDFYSKVFGLRTLFNFHISEHVEIAYMGHSHGGKNGSGYQTAEEMNREKNNIEGLIEMIYINVPNKTVPGNTDQYNSFSHVGIVVPDVNATQKRLEAYGALIIKGLNEPIPTNLPIIKTSSYVDIFKLGKEEQKLAWQVLDKINIPIIYSLDPDNNMVEIQSAEGAALTQG